MPREAPSWVRKLAVGRAGAIASMTPEEIAERAADAAVRVARRAQRVAEAHSINEAIHEGQTPEEIAAAIGIAPRSLFNRAKRWGIVLMRRRGFRWLSAWVSEHRIPALDCLAADLGVTRAAALERLLDAALADGAHVAKRTLQVKRLVAA